MRPRSCDRGKLQKLDMRWWPLGLQCGHGHVTVESKCPNSYQRTNFKLQCGHGHVTVESKNSNLPKSPPLSLQCGHGHVTVESTASEKLVMELSGASMRPRSCDRGKSAPQLFQHKKPLASMRPRSCDRGKGIGIAGNSSARQRFNAATVM